MEIDGRLPTRLKGENNYCIVSYKTRLIVDQNPDRERFESYVNSYPDDECDFKYVFLGVSDTLKAALDSCISNRKGDPEKPKKLKEKVEALMREILGIDEELDLEAQPSLS